MATRDVPIEEGERIISRVESLTLKIYRDNQWQEIKGSEVFGGRKVIIFGLPGAFTPTCSTQHLPRYNEMAPTLFELGIDEILCLSVNDPFVMEAWGRAQQCCNNISLLADGNGEFSQALGLLVDKKELSFGMRSKRYSMLVDNGVVKKLFIEPDEPGDPYQVSDADTMLKAIDPNAKAPDQIVIFTRTGCPHCAHAKEMLEQAGFKYVEMPLADNVRHTVIGAISGSDTVPQIFLNGELIGSADDLEERLGGSRKNQSPARSTGRAPVNE
ncbi:MAG: glutathione peroxidase [Burkholderiaceae bacterium]